MRAGKLRHRVVIQSVTETVNTVGERTESASTATTRWASIEPVAGGEGGGVLQTRARATHLFTFRYYALSPKTHRLSWGGRIFGIEDVQHTNNTAHQATMAAAVEIK